MRFWLRWLLTLVFAMVWLSTSIGLAQKTTPYTSPDGLTGTSTTTTKTLDNGNTVETVTHDTSGTLGGQYVHDVYTSTIEKDSAGNVIKQGTRQVTTKFDKDPKQGGKQLSQDTFNQTGTVNQFGQETRVTDESKVDNKTGETSDEHTESTFDAHGAKLKSHRTTKSHKPGQRTTTKEEDWDAETDTYKEVSMAAPVLTPIASQNGTGASDETAYLPDVAGPGSTVVATFNDPEHAGPSGQAVVAFQDSTGHRSFFRAVANAQHHLFFKIAEGAVAVWLFKDFTGDGKPDEGAVECAISRAGTVADTQAIADAPQNGLAITRGATAYERGGASRGIVSLQTRGNDPAASRILVDGKANETQTVASSDMNVKAALNDDVSLGRHELSVESNGRRSNSIAADVVTLRADPVAGGETGTVNTLTVHVEGLPAQDNGIMYFTVSGSARLEDGSETTHVPVRDGIAQVRIRGVRSGPALVKYKLQAQLARG